MEQIRAIETAADLKQKGLLTTPEYEKLKSRILSGDAGPSLPSQAPPATPPTSTISCSAIDKLANSVDKMVRSVLVGNFKGTKRVRSAVDDYPMDVLQSDSDAIVEPSSSTPKAASVTPRSKRPAPSKLRQQTCFEQGVENIITTAQGKTLRTKEPTKAAVPLAKAVKAKYPCRWCSQTFSHAPARAVHEKSHKGPRKGEQSLFDAVQAKEKLSERERDREIKVAVTFTINDIISELEKSHNLEFAGKKGKLRKDGKLDGRVRCQGAKIRVERSPAFKWRVIRAIDRLRSEYPQFPSECAEMCADEFNCTRNQVNTWVRERAKWEAKAKTKDKKQARDRKLRGKFHKAEAEIHKEFLAAREQGKRVGPHWLRQCARRHVQKMYTGTPLEGLAKQFTAKAKWMRRFRARFKIVLRRKTNVKRIPTAMRIPKIKRWFALFRRRLRNEGKGEPGFDPKWGKFKLQNRWSLDQVPAGFFDPRSTYDTKGVRTVHIASNECSDSHRECTLQVSILLHCAFLDLWMTIRVAGVYSRIQECKFAETWATKTGDLFSRARKANMSRRDSTI